MITRIKKNISVVGNGKIWFSGCRISLRDMAALESLGYEVDKITEVTYV